MYKHLLVQRITRYNNQWYCYLCNSPQLDLKKAKSHFQETHLEQISTTNQILEFLENSGISNKQSKELLYNGVVLQNLPNEFTTIYFCIICKCNIPTLIHVYEHIKGRQHTKKLVLKKEKEANIEKENFTTVQQNLSRKQNLEDEIMIKLVEQLENLMTDCIKVKDGLQDYFCKICECWLPTLNHVCEHVKGRNHQINKTATTEEIPQNNSNNFPRERKTQEENLMTDCIKVKDGSQDYFCKICECLLPTLNHVFEHMKGRNHQINKTASTTGEKPQNNSNNFPRERKTQEENLLTDCIKVNDGLQDYFCKICECWIPTLNHVFEHVKGRNHQINKTASTTEEKPQNNSNNFPRKRKTQEENLMTDCIKVKDGLQDYFCKICECWLPTLNHVCEHVKGRNHQINKTATTEEIPQNNSNNFPRERKTQEENLMTDCIKVKDGSQDYFCEICECWIPTLNHVCEHVKGRNHQINKTPSIIKEKPQNDQESSNNDTDSDTSTSEEVSTSQTQTLICTMNKSINPSINMSLVKHNVSKTQELQCVDNIQPVAAANTNEQDIISSQDKKATSGLFISSDIFNEINTLLSTTLKQQCSKTTSKTTVQQKRTPLGRYNIMYPIDYLRFEKIMFSCREWKLSKIKENLKFYIPSTDQSVICLICNIKHSSCDIQVWYEHISCNKHKQLSNKKSKLLKQLMSGESTNIVCHACSTKVEENMISIHINEASHKMNRDKLLTQFVSLNYYDNLLIETLDPLCYAIQYFACVPCKRRFKMKVEFMDHLHLDHINSVKFHNSCKEFSFCVICAILWYENKACYSKHCSHPIHLYLKKSNDFAIKPLPQEVTKLLKHIDQNVDALFKASENVSIKLNTNRVVSDLEYTLKSHDLSAVKVHKYGSRYTGLAMLNSDFDIYLDFGGECNEAELAKSRNKQIEKCLRADYKVWKIKEVLENTRTPIIKLIHISTGINCDISYMNGLSVENSKFIKSFNNAYLPCRKLILFLRKWMHLCNFTGLENITNYALVWLVIFYLQVKHGIPSVASLIKRHKEFKIISGWRTSVSYTFTIDIPELPMHELLLGFFKFYGEFDYMHSVICPLLGRECDKQLFAISPDIKSTFPEDMEPYVTHLQGKNREFFRIDSAMCVQDPFVLSFNITRAVQVLTLRSFKEYCKESVSILST